MAIYLFILQSFQTNNNLFQFNPSELLLRNGLWPKQAYHS